MDDVNGSCFELLGYDILIDEEVGIFLLVVEAVAAGGQHEPSLRRKNPLALRILGCNGERTAEVDISANIFIQKRRGKNFSQNG